MAGGFANVTNSGSITAGNNGIGIAASTNATVTNDAGANIAGGADGIAAFAGSANVTNSSSITGAANIGIIAATNATVVSDPGASITGGVSGIGAHNGFVTTSGAITGTSVAGIVADTNSTVINNAGATFQTLPGASFVVNGAAQAIRRRARHGVGGNEVGPAAGQTAATFEGEFSEGHRVTYAGKGVVHYDW